MSLREVIAELDVQVRGLGEVRQANAELDAYVGTVRPAISRVEALRVKQAEHAEMVTRLTQRLRQLQAAQGDNSAEILQTRVAIQRASAASAQYGAQANAAASADSRRVSIGEQLAGGLSVMANVVHVARAAFDVLRAAAHAVWEQLEAIIESGSRFADLSQQLHVSSDRLQEWGFIAEQAGTTLETITRGLEQVARTAGRGADVYRRLGVATRDSNGGLRSQESILDDTLTALAGVENGTERATLAQQVFGRGAREMLGIVGEGPASLEELRERFRELGGGMSEDGVRASAEAADALDELGFAMRSLRDTLAPVVLPAITALAREIATGVGSMVRMARETSILSNAWRIFQGTVVINQHLWRLWSPIFRELARPLVALVLTVDDVMTAFRGGRSTIGDWVEQITTAHGHTMTFLGVIEALRIRFMDLRTSAYAAAEAVLSVVPGAGDALAQVRAARASSETQVAQARAQLATDEAGRFAERRQFTRNAAVRSEAAPAAGAGAGVQMQTTIHVTSSDPEAAGRAVAREQRRELRRAADSLARGAAT